MTEKKKKKNKNSGTPVFIVICYMILGAVIGSRITGTVSGTGGPAWILICLVLLYAAFFLQIIFHEGGHLAAGLMSGYRFSSFRIGSLVLVKYREGLSFRRYSLAGTGGQCLLIPPDRAEDGSYPYRFYHLGGVLMNLLTAALSFFVSSLLRPGTVVCEAFFYLGITGILCAVTNGIPMQVSGVATDGYNVLHTGKEPFAADAMWLHLKINEAQTDGIRLRELPSEWFTLPGNADKGNVIIAALRVFAENRAMDEGDLANAEEIIETLENDSEYNIIGLYRDLLLIDRITIDLIRNGQEADVTAMGSAGVRKFLKQMKKYPSVIRTEYAVSLLKKKDMQGAEKYRKLFDSVAAKYPYRSDIESERDIIAMIDDAAKA